MNKLLLSITVEHEPETLAHRMIHYFYHRQAIAKDAWDITFWQEFRRNHPDVELDAKALRSYFFHEVVRKPREWRNLPYGVIQYLNPLFNQIREEVLEFRDLIEGVDYMYAEDPADLPTVTSNTLPPLCLEPGRMGGMVSPSRATKRYITPSTEQIRSFVAAGLSELLWTKVEKTTKPTLDAKECMSRIGVLTNNSIALINCIEPGMACYERFNKTDSVEAGLLDNIPPIGTTAPTHTPLMHPIASSTPIPTTSRPGAEGSDPIRLRTPSTALRHVRSKPRKGVFKKIDM
uniref:Uncharacterized protein n=1 Tax=Anopheles christyi TaxID=43041 RepID=A0A182JRR3_9DIPT